MASGWSHPRVENCLQVVPSTWRTTVRLQRRIVKNRVEIDAALDHGLSQGLIESTNTKIRVLTRIAFGFKHPEALIALAMLALGGYRPDLPHQQTNT